MKRSPASPTAILAILGLAAPVATVAPARADVEIGGTAGLRLFSDDNGIGVEDSEDADSQKNSALFGVRLGVYFGDMLGAEAEVGVIPTEGRAMLYDVWNATYRASVVAQFLAKRPNQLVPFVLAGGGLHQIVDSKNTDAIDEDIAPVAHFGAGLKYRSNNGFGVRFDARMLLVPSSAGSGVTTDFEVLATIYRDLGWRELPPKAPEPPPPPADLDEDKDGIVGAPDQCPADPEDADGFQDEDGCPDLDNDADGVADAADRCGAEAEDKDGFADEDGCPEPDNDADGVADVVDKCATEPESRNGFLDEDGCADEVPEKLRTLTGAPLAVQFRGATADLAPGAAKALDAAAAVLVEIKEARIEIGAHTDDTAPPKGSKLADNQALSQARADAVKAYLVSKGVEDARLVAKGYADTAPVEPVTDLKGAKLTAARAKNRRVELKLIVAEAPAAPAGAGQPGQQPAPAAPATPAPAPATPAPAPAAPAQ